MVGALTSGGSWDLSRAKEKGNRWGGKGPKHHFGAGTPVLPGPGSCQSFPWSSCGFCGPQIEPWPGEQVGGVPVLELPLLAE